MRYLRSPVLRSSLVARLVAQVCSIAAVIVMQVAAAAAQGPPSTEPRSYVGIGAGVSTSPEASTGCGSPYLCGSVTGSTLAITGIFGAFVGTAISVGVEALVGGSIHGAQEGRVVAGGRADVTHRQSLFATFIRFHAFDDVRRGSVEATAGLTFGYGVTNRISTSGAAVSRGRFRLGYGVGADVVGRVTQRVLVSGGGRLHYLPRENSFREGADDAGVSNWLVIVDFKLLWAATATRRPESGGI